jgi:carbon storage regulator
VLVVTRKLNEAIVIGDGIEVVVLRNGRDGVRLGITAPAHVPVHRREIYDAIRKSNSLAAVEASKLDEVIERLRKRVEKC